MKVLGIAGSLRRDSWNRKLLRVALGMLERQGIEVQEYDIGRVSMYSPDVESETSYPLDAAALRRAIDAAGAVVIAAPEYNGSVPGVLKNAIAWASRPPNVLDDKVVFVMGAGPGRSGAVRMHMHLTDILESVGAWVVPQPRVLIPQVGEVITPDGQITDAGVRDLLEQAMARLVEVAARLPSAATSAEAA